MHHGVRAWPQARQPSSSCITNQTSPLSRCDASLDPCHLTTDTTSNALCVIHPKVHHTSITVSHCSLRLVPSILIAQTHETRREMCVLSYVPRMFLSYVPSHVPLSATRSAPRDLSVRVVEVSAFWAVAAAECCPYPEVLGPRRRVDRAARQRRCRLEVEAEAAEAGVRGEDEWAGPRGAPLLSAVPEMKLLDPEAHIVPEARGRCGRC